MTKLHDKCHGIWILVKILKILKILEILEILEIPEITKILKILKLLDIRSYMFQYINEKNTKILKIQQTDNFSSNE